MRLPSAARTYGSQLPTAHADAAASRAGCRSWAPPSSSSSAREPSLELVGELELGERSAPPARRAHDGADLDPGAARPRRARDGGREDRRAGRDGGADEAVVDAPTRRGSSVAGGPDDDELAGAQRAGHLVGAVEQAAEAAGERRRPGRVGPADEAHRPAGGVGRGRARRTTAVEREAAGVDDDQRRPPAPGQRGSCPPTAMRPAQPRQADRPTRTSVASRPQSSTSQRRSRGRRGVAAAVAATARRGSRALDRQGDDVGASSRDRSLTRTACRAGTWMTDGQRVEPVDHLDGASWPGRSRAARPSGELSARRPRWSVSSDVVGDRRAEQPADHAGRRATPGRRAGSGRGGRGGSPGRR